MYTVYLCVVFCRGKLIIVGGDWDISRAVTVVRKSRKKRQRMQAIANITTFSYEQEALELLAILRGISWKPRVAHDLVV